MLSLSEIKDLVLEKAKIIDAPPAFLPLHGTIEGSARPAIMVDIFGYHYIISERGIETTHNRTLDISELLYWIFSSVTFSTAIKYELDHRVEEQDFRRIMFQKQIELLNEIDKNFAACRQEKINEILKRHPFDDNASLRAELTKKFRDEGLPNIEVWERACSQYPLNDKPGKLLDILNLIGQFPKKDRNDVLEYLEHDEWGLALETICSVISENKLSITQNIYEMICNAGTEMQMDPITWTNIKPTEIKRS